MLRRAIAAAILACCLLPASASASYKDVINDCYANGKLTKKYTAKEYSEALAKLPTDIDEYSDCRDVIRRAQLAASRGDDDGDGGGAAGGTTGGPAAPTPDEQAAAQVDVDAARRAGAERQRIAEVDVDPGALAYDDFGAISKLPAPLVIFGAMLLAAALAVCTYLLLARVRAHRIGH